MSPAQNDRRVIIIGAGPGGLTAAATFSRVGIPVDVFEQNPEIKPAGGGLGVGGPPLKALQRIGVGQELLDVGATIALQESYSWRGTRLMQIELGEIFEAYGTPTISIVRRDLQKALLNAVPPEALHPGKRCVGVEQDGGGVTARFEDGSEERGAMLVGADGPRSVVRKAVIGDDEPRLSRVSGWRGVVAPAGDGWPRDTIRNYLGTGRMGATYPCRNDDDLIYWVVALVGADPPAGEPAVMKQRVTEAVEGGPEHLQRLVDATPADELIPTEIWERDPVSNWIDRRIALLGDAAHLTSPFAGQGAGMAIEDAVALAREVALTKGLEDQRMIEAAAEAYQQKRLQRANSIVLRAKKRGRQLNASNPVACTIRNTIMRVRPSGNTKRGLTGSLDYSV